MSIGLEHYRQPGADRLILATDDEGNATGVKKAELTFHDRWVTWQKGGSFCDGTVEQQTENNEFKQKFYNALVKSNGPVIANLALEAAHWPATWKTDGRSVSSGQVERVLDEAQLFRKIFRDQTEQNVRGFLRSGGSDGFRAIFAASHTILPDGDYKNPELIELFRREVRQDPRYGQHVMNADDLRGVAQRVIQEFADRKQADFRKQYRGLASFAQRNHVGTPREEARSFFAELTAKLSPGMAAGHDLSAEHDTFRKTAARALEEIRTVKDPLGEMSYDPAGMESVRRELLDKQTRLETLESQLTDLNGNEVPTTPVGQDLRQDLISEIRHQKGLLLAMIGFVTDVQNNDPLSQKAAQYSNMLWAHAVGHVIDDAIAYTKKYNPPGANDRVRQLEKAKEEFIQQETTAYNNASTTERTVLPDNVSKIKVMLGLQADHPVNLGKKAAGKVLANALKEAGLPRSEIDRLTSKKALSDARRTALNQNPDWAPISRDIVITRDGVTRVYRSTITPGAHINARFGRRSASNQPLDGGSQPHAARRGISSGTKADHYHARNLKVSKIEQVLPDGSTKCIGTVIGNGVLDMWDIADPEERARANERGAKEVLEAAIAENPRLRHEALKRAASGNTAPAVKLTHVSVNLTTPAGWRELPGMKNTDKFHDYQELTYTQEQFRAFEANSTAGQGEGRTSVEFQVDDDRPEGTLGQDAGINVDVDSISFSFGINPLATGPGPDVLGGWANVYEHNKQQMIKFIGDLDRNWTGGLRPDNFGGQGARPGGFIGTVYDRLENALNDPGQSEKHAEIRQLMGQMREQTNIVRDLFASEAFKRGNGDPAKMGREILDLQGQAEQALELLQVTDQAATMSKNCKSDKDRGGVLDVEFKVKVITRDMGGQIRPDAKLKGDDLKNYYAVAVASGQLENQRLNTGVPGSKEAGKLKSRIRDWWVRLYLKGLGKFASE
jgi:phosphatidylinositol-4,5-bisphosphate 4-phosphatase